MGGFNKLKIATSLLMLRSSRYVYGIGRPAATVKKNALQGYGGTAWASGLGKVEVVQTIAPGNTAITTGLTVAGNTNVLAATALSTARSSQTTFVAQPDVPRTLRFVAAKSGGTVVGDGTFTGTNARYVIAVGTDINDQVITEWIPLNDTTAVDSVKAFKTVTSLSLPIKVNATGDTVSCGFGAAFGLARPIAVAADIIEIGRKAGAATVYTIEVLSGHTFLIGVAASTLASAITASATSIALAAGGGAAFTNGSQRTPARIEFPDGTFEEVIITSRSTDTLTVVRGANGTTAVAAVAGTQIVARYGNTVQPTSLTAQDRFRLNYLASAI